MSGTILVCPLSDLDAQITQHRPGYVISLLDPEWAFPDLGAEYSGRHLRLRLHDICDPSDVLVAPAASHVSELLRFLESWDRKRPLLIHCLAGISRSTATAYIAACLANPEADEYAIARALRRVAPHARPNATLIALADDAMGRGGRMSRAMEATGLDLDWPDLEEGIPFQMPPAPR